MVETVEIPRPLRLQAWYLCALLHYQGKVNNQDMWCVALLRRQVTIGGLKNRWEFVEGLDYEAAKAMVDHIKPRLVRCTPGDLKDVVLGE